MKVRARQNLSGKKVYCLDYYVGKKRVRKTIGTNHQDAENVLAKKRVEILENRYFDVRRISKVTFGELASTFLEWSQKNNSKNTYSSYRHLVGPLERYFGTDTLIGSITVRDLEELKAALGSGQLKNAREVKDLREGKRGRKSVRGVATVNRHLSVLRRMFNKAIQWEMLEKNLVERVEFGKEIPTHFRFLSRRDFDLLVLRCPPHLRRVVEAAVYSGMRYGELKSLTWAAVDLAPGFITVRQSKSGRSREIPISTALREVLQAIPRDITPPSYVFRFTKRRRNDSKCSLPRPIGSVKTSFKTALRKAGIEGFRFHDLRHTFASWSVMMGMDLRTLADLLGHTTLKMVMRYAHLSDVHKKDAIERMSRYGTGQETGNGGMALAATS